MAGRRPFLALGGRVPSVGEIGLNQFAPYLMNRIMARWNATMADDLKAHDVTTTKMRVLTILSIMPVLTINELAVYGVTEQSTMSRTLDAMEEQGLVRRQPRPDDMRVRDVTITEDGRRAFETIWPLVFAQLQHLFEGVDEDEYRAFVATLHKVLKNIRKHEF